MKVWESELNSEVSWQDNRSWLWKGCEFPSFCHHHQHICHEVSPFQKQLWKRVFGSWKLIFSPQLLFQTGVKISYIIIVDWEQLVTEHKLNISYTWSLHNKLMRQVQLLFPFYRWKKYFHGGSGKISWIHFHWQMCKVGGINVAVNL